MHSQRNTEYFDLALILGLIVLTVFASRTWQAPLSESGGLGWDGVIYANMARHFANHEPLRFDVSAPFIYRVAEPWLVSRLSPGNILDGFKYLNLFFATGSVLLFAVLLRRYVPQRAVRIVLCAMLIVHWAFPLRFLWHYPVNVDPSFLFLMLFGVMIITRFKDGAFSIPGYICLLALFGGVAIAFRESTILLLVANFFVAHPEEQGPGYPGWKTALRKVLPAFPAVFVFSALHQAIPDGGGYSFVDMAMTWLYNKRIGVLLLSYFMILGPFIPFLVFFHRHAYNFIRQHIEIGIITCGFALVSIIGGTDTQRFVVWMMPFVYIIAGNIYARIRGRHIIMSAVCAATFMVIQVFICRLLWLTPDSAETAFPAPNEYFLTPLTNQFNYLIILPELTPVNIAHQLLEQYLAMSGILFLALYATYRRSPGPA